ncbi:MAG TPA: glycosyltransferase, partial [Candidatus Omnitrophota bacterium]|nr:glycosyltransferase [Candidatus Omnitrophota bacterium]
MSAPLTVITPVLNGERFIERCLLNVRDQNCAGLEHLVIDGGSSDRTPEIVRDWQAQLPYV